MRIQALDAARAIGGELIEGTTVGPDAVFDGASFDTRTLQPGQLFVALVAARDGHDFIPRAVDAGAGAVLASVRPLPTHVPVILVNDTARALMELAAWARRRIAAPVVAVTGSVGKTSTKDLIAAALGATRQTTANRASFNNEQGLPVTILDAPDDVQALVVELGMRGLGEIARLADVAAPTIGVVTRVAASHTERLGGIDGVAVAKRELVEALPVSGTAILNADDPRVIDMAAHTDAAVITYGAEGDIAITNIELDERARARVALSTPWGSASIRLAIPGSHMASNAAAAIAVAGIVEGTIDAAAEALERATVSEGRMQTDTTGSGALVINDAYNANPDSTSAALSALQAMRATRRFAVLGSMAELDDPVSGHRAVAEQAERAGIELIAVGTELYGVPSVDGIDAAVRLLGELGVGDVVLVKASNSARLWRVAERLLGESSID